MDPNLRITKFFARKNAGEQEKAINRTSIIKTKNSFLILIPVSFQVRTYPYNFIIIDGLGNEYLPNSIAEKRGAPEKNGSSSKIRLLLILLPEIDP
jgi:hypothetical protein